MVSNTKLFYPADIFIGGHGFKPIHGLWYGYTVLFIVHAVWGLVGGVPLRGRPCV